MPRILFATDYSPAAQNAALYAAELAAYLGVDLELVHVYIIPFAYTDSPVPLLNLEEIRAIASSSMVAEKERLGALFPNLGITYQILPGEVIECLNRIIEKDPPTLVVLGTAGESSEFFLWGSVATKALRALTVPVLAVPTEASWKPIRKICFAADYQQISDATPLDQVVGWARQMQADLSVVHVESEKMEVPAALLEGLSQAMPEYHSVKDADVATGIQVFLQEQKADWLLVIPRKYGFFENLFHRSRTKALARQSEIPVLSLYQK